MKMEINEREYLIELFYLYKNLLTKKQVDYFNEYFILDYSLKEISENNNVSRSACYDALKKIEKILINYEDKLNLLTKSNKIKEVLLGDDISTIKEKITNIIEE